MLFKSVQPTQSQPRSTAPAASAAALPDVHSDAILQHLTTRQHVRPHDSISDILDQTTERFGCCPKAIQRGIEWLGIDPSKPIGRLRRSELVQLAKAVHRFWMQNAANGVSE